MLILVDSRLTPAYDKFTMKVISSWLSQAFQLIGF